MKGAERRSRVVAVVGMCGAGKSVACDVFRELGWGYVRFGQITIDLLKEEGRPITPEEEKEKREALRREHGMGAYALLSLPKIERLLGDGPVVADGLYSWSEYKILRERFGERFSVLCVYASPETRYGRLGERRHREDDRDHRNRMLTPVQARARDYAEIENIEKGGPIAMADFTVSNESSLRELRSAVRKLARGLEAG